MHIIHKWASTFLGVATFGTAVLVSASAKANCDDVEYNVEASPNTQNEAADYCSHGGGSFAYLDYLVAFQPHSSGGPMPGYGFGSNQIILYTTGGTNQGYNDGVFLLCANEGWLNSGWTGHFTENLDASLGQGGYPPSSFKFCNSIGDAAEEVEGYVYLY
jgi:hypothetical protein